MSSKLKTALVLSMLIIVTLSLSGCLGLREAIERS